MRTRQVNLKSSGVGCRVGACLLIAAALACSDEDRTEVTERTQEMETPSPLNGAGGTDGESVPDCFEDPRNHFEIINACTRALRVEKNPDLLLLEADGSLPPP